jgi:FkbM family methyltransferase
MKSYSQEKQDLWVVEKLKEKRNGFFVEAGAGNGIRLSNTYLLETEFGWDGICVEPYAPNFVELEQNRSCKCVCTLLDGEFGEETYSSGKVPTDGENPQGYRGGIVSKSTDNTKITNDSFTMQTVTLEYVLDEQSAPTIIDYFSLDVEGAETRILRKFPFNKYKFRILHIERPSAELCKILENSGYVRDGGNRYDCYFVNTNLL